MLAACLEVVLALPRVAHSFLSHQGIVLSADRFLVQFSQQLQYLPVCQLHGRCLGCQILFAWLSFLSHHGTRFAFAVCQVYGRVLGGSKIVCMAVSSEFVFT